MWRSWCVLLAAMMAGAACSAPPVRAALSPGRPGGPDLPASVRVHIAQEKAVRTVRLEDYVRAAIISEYAPPDGEPRLVQQMLEVQAVIARTYAVANLRRHAGQGYDLCSSTHCQLHEPSRLKTSRWAGLAAAAVKGTAGQLLWYRGTAVNTLFHADCGGHTSTSSAAWGGSSHPYLVAISDDGPARTAHAEWAYRIPLSDLSKALNADTRTSVGKLRAITIRSRDRSGRAETIILQGDRERAVRGEDFRTVLSRHFGARGLKSTLFDVKRDGDVMIFTGRGFGHGVGLCQAGALARLRAGASVAAVLKRYYPGTTLAPAN
jgi:stage II sporulation protein D